ncbi:hypothetical protein VIGAN_11044400, partial [Vigna angularis var. angularis]
QKRKIKYESKYPCIRKAPEGSTKVLRKNSSRFLDYNIKLFGVFTIIIVDTSVTPNHNIKDDDNRRPQLAIKLGFSRHQ